MEKSSYPWDRCLLLGRVIVPMDRDCDSIFAKTNLEWNQTFPKRRYFWGMLETSKHNSTHAKCSCIVVFVNSAWHGRDWRRKIVFNDYIALILFVLCYKETPMWTQNELSSLDEMLCSLSCSRLHGRISVDQHSDWQKKLHTLYHLVCGS